VQPKAPSSLPSNGLHIEEPLSIFIITKRADGSTSSGATPASAKLLSMHVETPNPFKDRTIANKISMLAKQLINPKVATLVSSKKERQGHQAYQHVGALDSLSQLPKALTQSVGCHFSWKKPRTHPTQSGERLPLVAK
jgi:hypothetical protein